MQIINQVLYSEESGKIPSPEDMYERELAVNFPDKKIFIKKPNGTVVAFDCADSSKFVRNDMDTSVSGHISALGFNTLSAAKYKENIEDFTRCALDLLKSTKIVTFNYKTDVKKEEHIGFIADYTPPELSGVGQNSFRTQDTIAVLIQAVKELSARVEALESRLS